MTVRCLITCEHASRWIPPEYRTLFRGNEQVLQSHRGYDPGAAVLAKIFRRRLQSILIAGTTSRLLVELNRSQRHPQLFSEFTRNLPEETRAAIVRKYYMPHWQCVERTIAKWVDHGEAVVHLGVHTFTPVLHGEVRNADVGLLYDPGRRAEQDWCCSWQDAVQHAAPHLRIRRNYPYLGKSDGLTTSLRRLFPERCYLGIELEVNQKWAESATFWRKLGDRLAQSFATVLESTRWGRHARRRKRD